MKSPVTKNLVWITFLAAILLLCACQSDLETAVPNYADVLRDTVVAEAYRQTQANLPTSTPLPVPTLTDTSTPTVIPTIVRSQTPELTSTNIEGCNRLAAGNPLDVTIPDGSVMQPGMQFVKTWKLVNSGACKWTRLYRLVFFSGNPMEAMQSQLLQDEVLSGESVELSVIFTAPMEPGVYQSNWMLQSPDGELFGLGPNNDAPFWVAIEVVEKPTPTISATSTGTQSNPLADTPVPAVTTTITPKP